MKEAYSLMMCIVKQFLKEYVALEGGGGTASNPASETTGSVAFTQTLDSSGFQDGVDKFSKTVDESREVMTQSLNVEIGGTVTVDVNLKEGAAFLNDSKYYWNDG